VLSAKARGLTLSIKPIAEAGSSSQFQIITRSALWKRKLTGNRGEHFGMHSH
jgi:hypothetical protein